MGALAAAMVAEEAMEGIGDEGENKIQGDLADQIRGRSISIQKRPTEDNNFI